MSNIVTKENAMLGAGTIINKNVEAYSLTVTRSPIKTIKDWVKAKINQYSGENK